MKHSAQFDGVPACELDLHGMSTIDAKIALDELFADPDFSHIRIIVGRGRNSSHGPVLPNFVKAYLIERGIDFAEGEGVVEVWVG